MLLLLYSWAVIVQVVVSKVVESAQVMTNIATGSAAASFKFQCTRLNFMVKCTNFNITQITFSKNVSLEMACEPKYNLAINSVTVKSLKGITKSEYCRTHCLDKNNFSHSWKNMTCNLTGQSTANRDKELGEIWNTCSRDNKTLNFCNGSKCHFNMVSTHVIIIIVVNNPSLL